MKKKIEDMIKKICPKLDLSREDLNLAEEMESIDIITLLGELEDAFDIEITMQEKTEENFENAGTIAEMVKRLKEA